MSLITDPAVQRALRDIDRVGSNASKRDWIDLCEEVSSYYETSADAAREELQKEEGS